MPYRPRSRVHELFFDFFLLRTRIPSCVSSSFQLEPSRTIVAQLAFFPILGDLHVEYSSGQVCKCVPGRPIGLTEARVSDVVL